MTIFNGKLSATIFAGVFTILAATFTHKAQARDYIHIVGSSTVFPFASVTAERFGRSPDHKTPVVESTGTGGGFKLLCAGLGDNSPDIATASRAVKQSEIDTCKKNGVSMIELPLGYDGIAIANSRKAQAFALTRKQLFMALAKLIPLDGKLIDNPYKNWSDVSPKLPNVPIRVFGPPPTSGTRDAFIELVMQKGALKFPYIANLKKGNSDRYKAVSSAMREDGAFIEAGENDNLIVQKLLADPTAIGIFGFSFLEENGDLVQGSAIEGVKPSFETIADSSYLVSRLLYVYIKKEHINKTPGLKEFSESLLAEEVVGEDGYLIDKGLIPLPAAELAKTRKDLADGKTK